MAQPMMVSVNCSCSMVRRDELDSQGGAHASANLPGRANLKSETGRSCNPLRRNRSAGGRTTGLSFALRLRKTSWEFRAHCMSVAGAHSAAMGQRRKAQHGKIIPKGTNEIILPSVILRFGKP